MNAGLSPRGLAIPGIHAKRSRDFSARRKIRSKRVSLELAFANREHRRQAKRTPGVQDGHAPPAPRTYEPRPSTAKPAIRPLQGDAIFVLSPLLCDKLARVLASISALASSKSSSSASATPTEAVAVPTM